MGNVQIDFDVLQAITGGMAFRVVRVVDGVAVVEPVGDYHLAKKDVGAVRDNPYLPDEFAHAVAEAYGQHRDSALGDAYMKKSVGVDVGRLDDSVYSPYQPDDEDTLDGASPVPMDGWKIEKVIDMDDGGKGYVMSPEDGASSDATDDEDDRPMKFSKLLSLALWEKKTGMSYDEANAIARRVMDRGYDSGVVFELLAVRKLVMDALELMDTYDEKERIEVSRHIRESMKKTDNFLEISQYNWTFDGETDGASSDATDDKADGVNFYDDL
jgi:hypothetical protein